jgi:hypothetical protein
MRPVFALLGAGIVALAVASFYMQGYNEREAVIQARQQEEHNRLATARQEAADLVDKPISAIVAEARQRDADAAAYKASREAKIGALVASDRMMDSCKSQVREQWPAFEVAEIAPAAPDPTLGGFQFIMKIRFADTFSAATLGLGMCWVSKDGRLVTIQKLRL